MHLRQQQLVYTPTDLCLFMASPFALWMERYHLETSASEYLPDAADDMLQSLAKKGLDREQQLLEQFQAEGRQVVCIHANNDGDRYQQTLDALHRGVDVIYQAYLEKLPFAGYADFLIKTPQSSRLGEYAYEVWDCKLSKQSKSAYMIQLCCYADMLSDVQGCVSERVVLALGDEQLHHYPLQDFYYYYQQLKSEFLVHQHAFDGTAMPDPALSKEWGRWSNVAERLLVERDHLSQVATMTRQQIKRLEQAGIHTMTQLAECALPRISKMNTVVYERLQAQARIQIRSRGCDQPAYEILIPAEGEAIGLALLPPAAKNDVFFDIEGFPLVDGGLEYLWGSAYFDEQGQRQFIDFWAHDAQQEKLAFQRFIQWVYQRWLDDPRMHIYHYANYEIAACRRLMGKYGICEQEVDELLRNAVFVDLYNVVRHGLLLGEPRYSIKNVEHLYRGKRETAVGSGGDSVVVYERWRETPDGSDYTTSQILNDIRDYNIDDCNSTQELVDWLREQQQQHGIQYLGREEPEQREISDVVNARTQLRDRLLQRAQQETLAGSAWADVSEMFAWLLEFHRREDKPNWWRLFDRMGMRDIDLMDDLDCIAMCERTARPPERPTPRARSLAYEYRFNANQEFKPPKEGRELWVLGHEGLTLKLVSLDAKAGLLTVQAKEEPPAHVSLIPFEIIRAQPIPEAIEAVALAYDEGHLGQCAIVDFLTRQLPRINGHPGGVLVDETSAIDTLQQVINLVLNLDDSYLCIQGPPGAGKTYTGKHIIAELVLRGKKIGIASNSHKAINNLVLGVAQHCRDKNIAVDCFCSNNTDDELLDAGIQVIKNSELAANVKPGCVLGTTAWGFARDDMLDQLDYLFVDEAGQVSVANLVAMSRSTKNIVLKGDQMQLGQPVQGTHPGKSGLSVLEYLLEKHATIPPELGVFLGTTYRMHPSVNRFISEMIYDHRLKTAVTDDRQIIRVPDGYSGRLNKTAGIIFVPVAHESNTQASEEEAQEIAALAKALLGRTYVDNYGVERALTWQDMLFMAPYNHQVHLLEQALGEQAKVGSVDKFQGQEAPVVFLSLCASEAGLAPRGLSFLLDKNRLNVAISRAQSLVVIVANPNICANFQGSVDEMRLVNLFSRLITESEVK